MMYRTAFMFFMSLLLTACDRYEERFLSGSFIQTKPGCHTLSGWNGRGWVRLCYPTQINVTKVWYPDHNSQRHDALVVNDGKGAAVTVWVSESDLKKIGTVTVNTSMEKTTWGTFVSVVTYLLAIATVIAIFIFIKSFVKSKAFRLNSAGGVFGILAGISTWLLVSFLVGVIQSNQFINAVFVLFIGPILGLVVGGLVREHFCAQAKKECPKCNGSDIENYSSNSYSYDGTETKTSRVTHFNKDHEERGYSEAEYEVPTTFTSTTYLWRCKTCKHEWTKG